MAEKKQKKQKKPQLTKEQRHELERKLDIREGYLAYIERRIIRERADKEAINAFAGKEYRGVLHFLEDSVENIKNDTFWELTSAEIKKQLK